MIIQLIYLKEYDWLVKVYYAVDTYYKEEILNELSYMDCSEDFYDKAESIMTGEYNEGFTYSNADLHVTLMVIGLTDDPAEFSSTLDHEKGHAVSHIAEALEIDPMSEQYQYLAGELGKQMFKEARHFLCEHCRQKLTVNLFNHGKMKIKLR